MAEDLNSFTILGFSDGKTANPSLTPIRGDRQVIAYLPLNKQLEPVWVREPFRDCNKIYAAIRALPSDAWSEFEGLEDIGINQQDYLDIPTDKLVLDTRGEVSLVELCRSFVGGGWLESTEKLEKQKIVLAVIAPTGPARLFTIKVSDPTIKGDESMESKCLLNIVKQKYVGNCEDILAVIPIFEPKRQVDVEKKSVYFIG